MAEPDQPCGKKQTPQGERVVAGTGKQALTHCLPLARRPDATLLLVVLGTGRTHQIRVHLAEAGHSVCGDGKYGTPGPRLLLHAAMLHWSEQTLLCWPDWPAPYDISPGLRERIPHLVLTQSTETFHV